MAATQLDALIIGAGFGGIYQLYTLRKMGLNVRVIDAASDVGGTWYWNRYPGAMSDTESYVYRFSWDEEDLRTYPWTNHYVKQTDVLAYLEHVVERHELRKDMQFETEMVSATWNESGHWEVRANTGQVFHARYLITALGLLSKPNYPAIPGLDTFKGELCHTAAWDTKIKLADKRVGVIGCGSTGVQVITEISKYVKELVSFQRHPQYSVPSGDGPVSEEYRKSVNEQYPQIVAQVKGSITGFGFSESKIPFHCVPEQDRDAVFEEQWQKGNGFRFMFGGFSDVATNKDANEAACEFIRRKIGQIVKDPEKAEKLKPYDYYARRPLCDGGYYEQFNRPHVRIVDLKETPISSITGTGIQTSDGKVHELDVIIMATGFDAIDGNYNRVRIQGVGGVTLRDHWADGPTSYLGVSVPRFPNLFMITGPQGPFSNIPPAIESHVEFITKSIQNLEDHRVRHKSLAIMEALPEAESSWNTICEREVEGSLFKETASWIFGANVPGKKLALRFYFGGLGKFRGELESVVLNDWRGYKPLTSAKT
jgi:cyclohexanone monooxygenase